MTALYDQIGENYDATRRADPVILSELAALLEIRADGRYLDIACGTGNYTVAIRQAGGDWHACDVAEKMLREARAKSDRVVWSKYDVCRMGYAAEYFDGAMCTLAVHHFPDLVSAFSEIGRVLKPDAGFVIFTATPEQMETYWLCHYFPAMMKQACEQMPVLESIENALARGGLRMQTTRPFDVTPGLADLFLYSGKYRPERYLSEGLRRGISSFHNFCGPAELKQGLSRLEADIHSGAIRDVVRNYGSDRGDYLFICAAKYR